MKKALHALIFTTALSISGPSAWAAEDVMIVYDASGSMWAQVDGINKIVIAREVMADLLKNWPQDTRLGLVAYGHRTAGDCRDIETLIKPGAASREQFIQTVNDIQPKGKTPISAALRQAADELSFRDTNATVVLISDGLETCHADPCAVASELAEKGVDFTVHVVGFDLDEKANKSLSCIASNTGGIFVPASNAAELKAALLQVQDAVEKEEAEPVVAPKPDPTPEPEQPAVGMTAPKTVIAGARFDVSWTDALNPRDLITITPADAKEGTLGDRLRVQDKLKGTLTAAGGPGMYEVRYVQEGARKTLGSTPVEVVATEMGLSAPGQVTVGARFDVSWTSAINPRDFITITPAGAKEGTLGDRIRVNSKLQGTLVAPSKPGLYEARYVLNQGQGTLASAPIEVVLAQQAVLGPDIIRAGTPVDVSWSIIINPRDLIGIAPSGSADKTLDDRKRVDNRLKTTLTAPKKPGLYEIRYVLNEGFVVQARHNIEVVAADAPLDFGAGLKVPTQATPGQTIKVSWTGAAEGKDQRVALAALDQADFTWIDAKKANESKTLEFDLPDKPGDYEIRYLDVSERTVLGRAIVKVQ